MGGCNPLEKVLRSSYEFVKFRSCEAIHSFFIKKHFRFHFRRNEGKLNVTGKDRERKGK
jgi:hypothetical protein